MLNFNKKIHNMIIPFFEKKGFMKNDETKGTITLVSKKYKIKFTYDYQNSYELNIF